MEMAGSPSDERPHVAPVHNVDKTLAKCKQPHVKKPRLECRDLSESRNDHAHTVKKNSPLRQIALPMSAHHVATNHHVVSPEISRHTRRHHQYQSPPSTIPRFQFHGNNQHQHQQVILYPQPPHHSFGKKETGPPVTHR